jgi:tetratricopeptide (TPR) repeat protein
LLINTIHLTPNIYKVFESNESDDFITAQALDEGIDQCESYIARYGTRHGFTNVYKYLIENYYGYGDMVLRDYKANSQLDTIQFHQALRAAKQGGKILSMFNRNDEAIWEKQVEADLFMVIGKKDEAIRIFTQLLSTDLPEQTKDTLKRKIEDLKND